MYSISYMWYAVIGTITCVLIGIIIGLITGKESDKFDERLLHPFVAKIYRKMPGNKRTFIVKENEKESSVKTEVTVAEDIKTDQDKIDSRIPDQYSSKSKIPDQDTSKPHIAVIYDGKTNTSESKEVFSPNSSRLFDAYEVRRSPTPTRTRM